MRLLLGSGGFRTPERIAFLVERMRACFGRIERLLFVPYALRDHDGYVEAMKARGLDAGYRLEGIHRCADPVAAIREAQGIFVGGGNTFRLQGEMLSRGLMEPIRQRVRAGMPYLGVSAGCNLACPTVKTTNDMPITWPPTLDALGLVPFQVNPHYFADQIHVKRGEQYVEHFGETRDERIREFHEMNDTTVIGLWEGGALWVEDGTVSLEGSGARIFRKGLPPMDVEPGSKIERWLGPQGPKLAYTVGVSFQDMALASAFLDWLHSSHLDGVLTSGAEFAEVVELDAKDGRAFEIRYRFPSREAFTVYEREHAPRLRQEALEKFPTQKGVYYHRTTGLIV